MLAGLPVSNSVSRKKILLPKSKSWIILVGRYFIFNHGKITSKSGIHSQPDVCLGFSDAALGSRLLVPWSNRQEKTDAMKNFRLTLEGQDELTYWFMETLSLLFTSDLKYGMDMGKGVKRYVNNSNAGPMFVYVKDGKIIRMTPIEFDDSDAPSFTIEARGKKFTPPRKSTLSPFGFSHEIHGLFPGPDFISDETGRFRS